MGSEPARNETAGRLQKIVYATLRRRGACDNKISSRLYAVRRRMHCSQRAVGAPTIMPARETEAIILKTFPLGEADRLVSFLGRSSGRIRGVAAGARRLKNRYGSTLEILSHVRVWYVEKETRDLVRIQQCELLESFHRAQSDYSLSTGLAVVSEVAELVLPEAEAADSMFRLILLTTREVDKSGQWILPLAYFSFWTMRLGGWLPSFERCSGCGKPFGSQPAYAGSLRNGLFCGDCRRSGMRAVHVEARQLAERFSRSGLEHIPWEESLRQPAKELSDASLDWIEFNVERKLHTRELLESS